MNYEIDDKRRALLGGMEGNDIPGPDGTGGLAGRKLDVVQDTRTQGPGILPGEPNPNGPAQAADPFAYQAGRSVEDAMQAANNAAYGYNKHQDANYWRDMYAKDPEYTWKRMIGMGAGPQDAAKFGQWAGGDPNAEQLGGGGGVASRASDTGAGVMGGMNMGDIMAEIQALMSGQQSPSRRSAILSQLQG